MTILTNKDGIPEVFVRAITKIQDNYSGGDSFLSSSSACKSPRQYYLQKRYSDLIEVEASSLLASLQGTIIHYILEAGGTTADEIVEERYFKNVVGEVFSGQIDHYCKSTKTLTDYKYTTCNVANGAVKPEYEVQANLNKMLMEEAGHDVDELRITYFLKDWSKIKSEFTKGYPKCAVVSTKVKVWPKGKAERFITEHVKLLKSNKDIPDDLLPDCTAAEMWQDPPIYAVKKKGGVRAINGGLYKCEMDAKIHAASIKGEVEIRESQPIKCKHYCEVRNKCSQYNVRNKKDV